MLTLAQIARTLDFDAVLDLVEAAEAGVCARLDGPAPNSPVSFADLNQAFSIFTRAASIRKTLAHIHVTFAHPHRSRPAPQSAAVNQLLSDLDRK